VRVIAHPKDVRETSEIGDAEPVVPGRIASGADGGSLARRVYRRSPVRRAFDAYWRNRGIHSDDVLIASYPRSGNAWLRFLVQEMAGRPASFDSVRFEIPYVGQHRDAPQLVPGGGRFIKTHGPYLPAYRRAVHLVRDPRDVVLSYFRYMQRLGKIVFRPGDDIGASFDRFLDAFLAGDVAHGSWQSHLDSWTRAQESGADVLMIRYEEMRAEPVRKVGNLADWLGFRCADAELESIVERCSVARTRDLEREAIAQDPTVFGPRRAGIDYVGPASLGGWRDALTPDQKRRFSSFSRGLAQMGYERPE
jgi:hypothetical protein